MGFLTATAVALALLSPPPAPAPVTRHSRPLGTPANGSLRDGVLLPAEGEAYFTWDPVLKRRPDRPWRRWATDHTIVRLVRVLDAYAEAHPGVARVGVGDLSRPHGGHFGKEFGGLGHASHQNGLDVDVWYPRKDGLERAPIRPEQVDQRLAQDLVDRFVRAGAIHIFVGPHLALTGPRRIVEKLGYHDNHLHVRFRP